MSVAAYTFGALTFATLLFHYGRRGWRADAFGAFTLACALAFGINLPLQLGWFDDARWPSAWLTGITGLLAPLLWHVVWDTWRGALPSAWRWSVSAFYAAGTAIALLRAADDLEWISLPVLDSTAAWMMATTGFLGLTASPSQNQQSPGPSRQITWLRVLLGLMLLPLAAEWLPPGARMAMALLPDYLVLAFFCVTLYYREKVLFFDVVLRRGIYFVLGFLLLTAFEAPRDLRTVLLLLFGWMTAPGLYQLTCRMVDRYLLRRPLSIADAERQFWLDTQAANTESALREAALRSLSASFHTRATMIAQTSAAPEALTASAGDEVIALAPRASGYWSEDERLLLSLARTYGILRENVRLREREQDLRLLASRAELRALRAQINPHFLFNSLNAIAGLIHTEPALADATVEKLAEVFRYTLRNSEHEWVRAEEELDFVQAYLAIQQARFRERLEIEWMVEESAGLVTIPAMIIQPLVENAIVHGASHALGTGQVSLRMTCVGPRLRAMVRDNGAGFPEDYRLAQSGATHGLRNISDRLRGYYGSDAFLKWESGPAGSLVMWELPLERPH